MVNIRGLKLHWLAVLPAVGLMFLTLAPTSIAPLGHAPGYSRPEASTAGNGLSADASLHLKLPATGREFKIPDAESYLLRVYATDGKLLWQRRATNAAEALNRGLRTLQMGIYLLEVEAGAHKSNRMLFISS